MLSCTQSSKMSMCSLNPDKEMLFAGKNLLNLHKEAEIKLNYILTNLVKPKKNTAWMFLLRFIIALQNYCPHMIPLNWFNLKIWAFFLWKI